jgi:hypothetical protein
VPFRLLLLLMALSSCCTCAPSVCLRRGWLRVEVRDATRMADAQRPTPSGHRAVDSWVALGAGLGVALGAELGNVLFWIVIGAVAGLALGEPVDD